MDARSSYREAAVRGAGPMQLVIALYDQSIADLGRAIVALQKNDIEARTHAINHALIVIGHLQSTLNREQGGAVAAHLNQFYNQVRKSLIDANLKQSAEALELQVSCLVLVREAWDQIERSQVSPGAPLTERTQVPGEDEIGLVRDWNA